MNCKKEFLQHVGKKDVLCAWVEHDTDYSNPCTEYNLPLGYTKDIYDAFLKSLDFGYDNGYGGQEVFGLIWYKDGTWSKRGEYDGSEWWVCCSVPEIPAKLQTKEIKNEL